MSGARRQGDPPEAGGDRLLLRDCLDVTPLHEAGGDRPGSRYALRRYARQAVTAGAGAAAATAPLRRCAGRM